MKIAVMQPYFYPYMGYFNLFKEVDHFVIFDCVQFPRRGYVHRNQLYLTSGAKDWLTLPLAKADRDCKIMDMKLLDDFEHMMEERCSRFPAFAKLAHLGLLDVVYSREDDFVTYLERNIRFACQSLGFDVPISRSSSLRLSSDLKGKDRIIEICRRLGASDYFNLPGGRELYDSDEFQKNGVQLHFLSPYENPPISVLEEIAASL